MKSQNQIGVWKVIKIFYELVYQVLVEVPH